MASEAAVAACEGINAAVVTTKTVPQAFSAMFVVDREASLDENVEAMTEAIAEVRDGEVTTAVRDSQAADGRPNHAGDVMGLTTRNYSCGFDVMQVTL
jgi:dihydroxyacetone kinase-like predicted kinase